MLIRVLNCAACYVKFDPMKSNQLTVIFIKRNAKRNSKTGCWVWHGCRQSSGYGQIRYDGKMTLAHRLSWQAHYGPIPQGRLVLHHCDTPSCVNPRHLFIGTHRDNMLDCINKGRAYFQKPGIDFSFTRIKRFRKLTDDDVRSIRQSTWKLKHLSERYGVSMSIISLVRRGKRKQLVQGDDST